MKKFCVLPLLVTMIFSFMSCNAVVREPERGGTDDSPSGNSIADVLDQDYGTDKWLERKLLDYAVFNDYERSDADMKSEIADFMSSFFSPSGDFAKSVSRNWVSSNGSTRIVKVDSRECVTGNAIVQKGLNASLPVDENVSIDVYDVVDESTGEKRFAIIPNDRRIGNVLFVSDSSCWEEAKDTEPMKFLMDSFAERAREIMSKWNDISPDEVRKKAEEYGNLLSKDITVDSLKHRQYTSWRKVGGDDTILKTAEYEQTAPYNNVIHEYYGKDYKVGCSSTAIGIIMSCWRWPEKFVDIPVAKKNSQRPAASRGDDVHLSDVKAKYAKLNNWDGVYSWDGINNGSNEDHIAALLFNIAEFVVASYGTGGTTGTEPGYISCFDNMGYHWSKVDDACTKASGILCVASSIENGMPCLATDDKHDFTIDGFKMMQQDSVVRCYTIGAGFSYEDKTVSELQDVYYHANMGWGGKSNGWYVPVNVAGYNCFLTLYDIHPKSDERPKNDIELKFLVNDGVISDGDGLVSKSIKSYTDYNLSDFGPFGFSAPAGKHFGCWNTKADGSGTAYKAGDTINVSDNCTLYAIWEKPNFDYDVFFETDCVPAGLKYIESDVSKPVAAHVKYPRGTFFTYYGSIPDGKAYYGVNTVASEGHVDAPFNTEGHVRDSYDFLVGFLGLTPGNTNIIFYDHSDPEKHLAISSSSKVAGWTNKTRKGWDIRALDLKTIETGWATSI